MILHKSLSSANHSIIFSIFYFPDWLIFVFYVESCLQSSIGGFLSLNFLAVFQLSEPFVKPFLSTVESRFYFFDSLS